MTSTRSDLTARFQRRLENERVGIETTAARELKVLGESLRGVTRSVLNAIEADTAAWIGKVRGSSLRGWMWPLLFGLLLSAGIRGGSWAGARWLWTTIEQRIETLTVLRVDIAEARLSLAQPEEKTWSVEPCEVDGKPVCPAAGRLAGASAMERGRAACLEAAERGRAV
ncbi:MAG: hypothetical protein OXH52_15640 [Gammaproteobacteria bacterium]|nr:hypothetical protein [Gammaproteobacteria bacterium]